MVAGMTALSKTGRAVACPFGWWLLIACLRVGADDLVVHRDTPTLDRWMYPFGFELGGEALAPTFGSFDPRFDTRDGQFLFGWDLAADVPTDRTAARYLVKRLRVTVTCGSDLTFNYDPTPDDYRTYLTNSPVYVKDGDLGRPVDLVGVAFRSGYTAATFLENSPYGAIGSITSSNISIGTRNAYAAVYDRTGILIDLSNNVGQTNTAFTAPPFEFTPWASGLTSTVNPGELVPVDTAFTFDVNLQDPLVAGYVQSALREGRLRFIITSLHPSAQSGFGGGGSYPRWYTKENLLGNPAQLDLTVTVVGDTDTDHDGLPDDWERFYFGNLDATAEGDPDGDGVSNLAEYKAGTDPTRRESVLAVTAYHRVDGAAVLRFPVAPSQRITVERSEDLQTWSPANGLLTYPEPGVAEWIEQDLTVPPGEPPLRFHRVRVEL